MVPEDDEEDYEEEWSDLEPSDGGQAIRIFIGGTSEAVQPEEVDEDVFGIGAGLSQGVVEEEPTLDQPFAALIEQPLNRTEWLLQSTPTEPARAPEPTRRQLQAYTIASQVLVGVAGVLALLTGLWMW